MQPPEVDTAIAASPFFDPGWYALRPGLETEDAALEHYRTVGREQGISPHPLCDPDQLRVQLELDEGDDDPVGAYLRSLPGSLLSPHPLFDVARYLTEAPDAAAHRWGPVGHYLEHGASAGLRPNDWFAPGMVDGPGGLADWVRSRAVEYAEERATYVEWSATPPADPAREGGEPSTQSRRARPSLAPP